MNAPHDGADGEAHWQAERSRNSWADGGAQHDARDAFSLQSTEDFLVQYLGTITGVQRDEKELVACVDQAKRIGNVSWHASQAHDSLRLILTKYGVKAMDTDRREVLLRVPMHKIGWVMHFTEHTGQQVVVIEAGVPGSSNFKYFLYQAQSEAQAQKIVETFNDAFQLVHSKAVLERV